jgi:hypothetical protein
MQGEANIFIMALYGRQIWQVARLGSTIAQVNVRTERSNPS